MSMSAQQLKKMLEGSSARIIDTGVSQGKTQLPRLRSGQAVQTPKGLVFIKNTLILMKVEFVTEHVFDAEKKRRFRFDIAIPDRKIAIEYEGIFNTEYSGHTTVQGYMKDTEKYNLATIQGWRILRYTGNGYKQFSTDIQLILK